MKTDADCGSGAGGAETVASPSRHASPPPVAGWQAVLAGAIRDPVVLLKRLGLPADLADPQAAVHFKTLVPEPFLRRMRPGDADDPLLKQVLPVSVENQLKPDFSHDPLQESACQALPGMLQKYQGRALLVVSGACAVHCRYCFRRHFPYDELPRGRNWWAQACAALAQDTSVSEVILSGGDPLIMPDGVLERLVADLAAMPHLKRLRIHTRLPIVLPQRVTERLTRLLASWSQSVVLVIHANHAQEFDQQVNAAVERLRQAGVRVLNQAVLLAGINDSIEALVGLSEAIDTAGGLPYYLHQLDAVQGAAHFAVSDARALDLIDRMRTVLPGYLVPSLVREIPGQPSKTPLSRA